MVQGSEKARDTRKVAQDGDGQEHKEMTYRWGRESNLVLCKRILTSTPLRSRRLAFQTPSCHFVSSPLQFGVEQELLPEDPATTFGNTVTRGDVDSGSPVTGWPSFPRSVANSFTSMALEWHKEYGGDISTMLNVGLKLRQGQPVSLDFVISSYLKKPGAGCEPHVASSWPLCPASMDMFWQAALENQLLLPKLRTDSLQLAQVLLPGHGQEQ